MTALAIAGAAYARVNWSRWIADCPAPYCRSALQLAVGEPEFHCLDCGTEAPIVWPPNAHDIASVLSTRPDPVTRNWEPGETLLDLLADNLAHGHVPAGWLTAGQGPLLAVVGDRVVAGELGHAADPLAIGG